jgi:hypothetical protein
VVFYLRLHEVKLLSNKYFLSQVIMSEYQYYEFQAIDRRLTPQEQAEVSKYSSRAQVSPTTASFVYHYGNFRGDPEDVLASYFDAMLYITNWGTRQLMFRFPVALVNPQAFEPYLFEDISTLTTTLVKDHLILNIEFATEDGGDGEWVEGEGILSHLLPLRADILRGDMRAIYLGWLKIAEYEADFEEGEWLEPPVPPNLHKLTLALERFVEFFDINPDLIAAAAEASPALKQKEIDLAQYLPSLSQQERDGFLRRLLNGEQHLELELAKRLRAFAEPTTSDPEPLGKRTIYDLVELAKQQEQRRKAHEKRIAEEALAVKMKALTLQEASLWTVVEGLIEQRKTAAYDEAIGILRDLRELARFENRLPEFKERIARMLERYPTLSGLHRRINEARLL